jgi:hypothetical protein
MRYQKSLAIAFMLLTQLHSSSASAGNLPQLTVSENGHYFMSGDKPFLWLFDTPWYMSQKLQRDDVDYYIAERKKQLFTGFQIFLVRSGAGFGTQSAYGDPIVTNIDNFDLNPAYFEHLDYIVNKADEESLYIAIVSANNPVHQDLNEEKAYKYGHYLGDRYSAAGNVIWVLGGDVNPNGMDAMWRAFAEGLADGTNGENSRNNDADFSTTMISYHTGSPFTSSQFWHNESWLDFNSSETWQHVQTHHGFMYNDYFKKPAKPTVMFEPAYEGEQDRALSDIVRLPFLTFLSGGAGHSYGASEIWRIGAEWKNALSWDGARSMTVIAQYFSTIEWHRLVPDEGLFAEGGNEFNVAAYLDDGKIIALVSNNSVKLNCGRIDAEKILISWLNPANGEKSGEQQRDHAAQVEVSKPAGWANGVVIIDAVRETGAQGTGRHGSLSPLHRAKTGPRSAYTLQGKKHPARRIPSRQDFGSGKPRGIIDISGRPMNVHVID